MKTWIITWCVVSIGYAPTEHNNSYYEIPVYDCENKEVYLDSVIAYQRYQELKNRLPDTVRLTDSTVAVFKSDNTVTNLKIK